MNCVKFSNISNLSPKIRVTFNEMTAPYKIWRYHKNPPGYDYYIARFGGQVDLLPDGNINSTFQPKKWTCDPYGLIDYYANTPDPTEDDPERIVHTNWLARGGYPWGSPHECSSRVGYVGYIAYAPVYGTVTFEPLGDAFPEAPWSVYIPIDWGGFEAQYTESGNILIPPLGQQNPICTMALNLFPTGGFYLRETPVGTSRWTFNPAPAKRFYRPETPQVFLTEYGGVGLNGYENLYAKAVRNDDYRYAGAFYIADLGYIWPYEDTYFPFFARVENNETITTDWGSVEITI